MVTRPVLEDRNEMRGWFRAGAALLPLLIASSPPARALWSSDPAHNLVIADGASEQVQPKIVPLADGGFYVSWFDNSTGGYDVRLQRLSASGTELWAHNGVLVADRGLSSTTDYGLSVDAAGNALLAFNDDSQPTERIVAAKFSPAGQSLWGAPGIAVSTSSGFLASPRIAGTADGAVVVAWIQDSDTVLQRIDAQGGIEWTAGGIILPHSGDSFLLADLRAAGTGLEASHVIVSWVRYVTFLGDKHLWAQKLDGNGAPLWGAGPVHVFDLSGGSLQFGNFPEFSADGAGGAVFAWYTSTPALQVRLQRILAAGTEAFAHNGVELSTDTVRSRVNPSATFDPPSQTVTSFWVETNSLQNQFGVYGQRLDGGGARLWGSSGIALVPLGGQEITQVRAMTPAPGPALAGPAPSDAIAVWAETVAFDDQPIRAERIDPAGTAVWIPALRSIKTSSGGTSRLADAASAEGFHALVWTDGESAGDLKAQNLNGDGSLGAAALFADGYESGNTGEWSAHVP
ncbi:MAG: hypothetical protein ABI639_08340 [Thermoanaerobaculia bacterium]